MLSRGQNTLNLPQLFTKRNKTGSIMGNRHSANHIAEDHTHTDITCNTEEPQQKYRLGTAVACRRNLLSRCLLTVPQHQDYLDSRKLTDDRYWSPWTRARPEQEFLSTEAAAVSCTADVLIQLSDTPVPRNEQYSPDYDDVVPSSNPESPDICWLAQTVWTPAVDVFTDAYEKVDLKEYCTSSDEFRIEVLSGEDCLKKTLEKLPSVFTLKERLRPIQVKDPLAQSKENFGKNDLRFSGENSMPILDQHHNSELFQENFGIKCLQEKIQGELENVVTPPCSQSKANNVEDTAGLIAVVGTQEALPIETEADVGKLVQNHLCPPKDCLKPEAICVSPVSAGKTSFLDINEIIITEEDKFCDRATLDEPVDDSVEENLKVPTLQQPSWDEMPLTDIDTATNICLLNEKEKQVLNDKIFANERFCDEIQASRLPEPSESVVEAFSKDEDFVKDDLISKVVEACDVKPCTDIGQTELSLPWDIVKYGSAANADTSKSLASLAVEGDCTIDVKEVETVEKYSSADIHDWKDPMVSVLEPPSHRKASANPILEEKEKTNKPFNADRMKADPKYQATLPTLGNDPLDDFMALRMNMVSSSTRQPAVIVPEKCESKVSFELEKTSRPAEKESRPTLQGRKKIKHHIVSVKLSDEFQQVLDLLADKASYMMQALKSSGDLSQSCSFEILKPDMTRFLLKQKERQIQDANCEANDTYRNIVGLHALSGAADITANCCLESAIAHISAVQEKYGSVLKGLLTDVREKLFEVKARFFKRQLHHPKIAALCKEIETWLKKKRAKSGDNEQKILVLIRRDLPSLLSCLKNVLGLGHLLVPEILKSSSSENIIQSLDVHNCLIAYSGLVSDHFPWAQFCLVVEYEYHSDTVWKDHCERQHIRHIALKLDTKDKAESSTDINWRSLDHEKQISLIASQNITKNIEMLQVLEARHNIVLVERDYSLIEGCQHLHFPDIDVDESCGIVLQPLIDLKDDGSLQALITKILALSLKLTFCWILLYSDKPNCYEYPGIVVNNMTKLEAAVANMSTKKEELEVKILTCCDLAEVAGSVRSIGEHCMTANTDRHVDDWLSRAWLAEEVSQGEKFLMMMPPITSFCAQMMLKKFTLKDLFSSDLHELSTKLPWMPVKVLKLFLKIANNVYGLHLRVDQRELVEDQEKEDDSLVCVNGDFEIDYSDKDDSSSSLEQCNVERKNESASNEDAQADIALEIDKVYGISADDKKFRCLFPDESQYSRTDQIAPTSVGNAEAETSNTSTAKLPQAMAKKDDKVNKPMPVEDRSSNYEKPDNVNLGYKKMSFNQTLNNKTTTEDWLQLENFIDSKRSTPHKKLSNDSHYRVSEDNLAMGIRSETAVFKSGDSVNQLLQKNYCVTKSIETYPQKLEKAKSSTQPNQNEVKNKQPARETEAFKNAKPTEQDDLYYGPSNYSSRNFQTGQRSNQELSYTKTRHIQENMYIDTEDNMFSRQVIDNKVKTQPENFLPSDIEQLVTKDLENFINGKFTDPEMMINQNAARICDETEYSDPKYNWRYPSRILGETMNEANPSNNDQNVQRLRRPEKVFAYQQLNINGGSGRNKNYRSDETMLFTPKKWLQTLDNRDLYCSTDYSLDTLLNYRSDPVSNDVERTRNGPINPLTMTKHDANLNQFTTDDITSKFFTNKSECLTGRKKFCNLDGRNDNFSQVCGENIAICSQGNLRETEKFFPRSGSDFDQLRYQQNRYSLDDNLFHGQTIRSDDTAEVDEFRNRIIEIREQKSPPACNLSQESKTRFNLDPFMEKFVPDEIRFDGTMPNTQYNPELGKSVSLSLEQLHSNANESLDGSQSGYLYINPQAERLSHRPQFIDIQTHKNAERIRTLEDDLRETTRKFLANSQQFSRFSGSSSRRPMQKLNIGLAVPLHRESTAGTNAAQSSSANSLSQQRSVCDVSRSINTRPAAGDGCTDPRSVSKPQARKAARVTTETNRVLDPRSTLQPGPAAELRQRLEQRVALDQKTLMLQSPWATDDSPPMDLDFGDEISQTETTNKAVFTSQTPQKKRKLTYQAVPGKKGQTRLVFQ